jgi:hypothetical protein
LAFLLPSFSLCRRLQIGHVPALCIGDVKLGLFDIVNKVDQYNVYAQDEWKFRSNLTINYGMRWEQNPPANSGKDSTFVTSAPIQNGPTPLVHAKSWYQQTKWGYFGPSLGIGWSPDFKSFFKKAFGGLGQSAIRLGYCIAYDPISSFRYRGGGSVPGLTIRCTGTMATQVDVTIGGGCPTVSDGTVERPRQRRPANGKFHRFSTRGPL